ncbi:MAG: hypothetical protein HQ446_01190 [Polaromonas sp.]|nr:hypothetical protein [Polaromonas sp.]
MTLHLDDVLETAVRRAALPDAQPLVGELPHGLARVHAIESWIHESICYLPGFSNATKHPAAGAVAPALSSGGVAGI